MPKKRASAIFKLPESATGILIRGSVYVNSRKAMRADEDVYSSCSDLPLNHPKGPFPVPAVLITTLTTTLGDLVHHEPAWRQAMATLVPRPGAS